MVAPVLGRVMKPLVKTAIKGGIVAYGWGREGLAEMQEYLEDTYAEANAEMGEPETANPRASARLKRRARACRADRG
jgi:hypothetical protein